MILRDRDLFCRLDNIERTLFLLYNQGKKVMATLKDIQDAVAAEATVDASVVALLGQLSQQLKDALAANDPVAVQAVVDQIDAQKQALADAVVANTPAAPAPTP